MLLTASQDPAAGLKPISLNGAPHAFQGGPWAWYSPSTGASVNCIEQLLSSGTRFNWSVLCGPTPLQSIDLLHPMLVTPASDANHCYSAFRGGMKLPWPVNGSITQSNAVYPGEAYAPLATWGSDTDAVGLIAHDEHQRPRTLYWTCGGDGTTQHVYPAVTYQLDLLPGQSASFCTEIHQGTDTAERYRDAYLAPWMRRHAIPEQTFKPQGPFGKGWLPRDGYNAGPTGDYVTGDYERGIGAVKALGAKGILQWPQPHPNAAGLDIFDGDPRKLPWWGELSPALAQRLGVNLSATVLLAYSALTSPDATRPIGMTEIHLQGTQAQTALAALRDDLIAHGVTLVYEDTGAKKAPPQWPHRLRLLADWAAHGIRVAPEAVCDVEAWATGTGLHFYWPPAHPDILNACGAPGEFVGDLPALLTPNATLFLYDFTAQGWWHQAEALGYAALLVPPQLAVYGASPVNSLVSQTH